MLLGEQLRSERERQGFDLTRIAEDLHIKVEFLEAIEAGDTDSIPGGFFYRSFVRQYAAALGIDPDQLEPELESERAREARLLSAALKAKLPMKVKVSVEASPSDPSPTAESAHKIPIHNWIPAFMLVGVIVCSSAVYAWWVDSHPSSAADTRSTRTVSSENVDTALTKSREVTPSPSATTAPETSLSSPEPEPMVIASATEPVLTSPESDPSAVANSPAEKKASLKSRRTARAGRGHRGKRKKAAQRTQPTQNVAAPLTE